MDGPKSGKWTVLKVDEMSMEPSTFEDRTLCGVLNRPLSSRPSLFNFSFSIQQTIQESRFGPNCVSECSMNGHSDQCWLIEFPRHFPRTQRSLDYHRSQGLIQFNFMWSTFDFTSFDTTPRYYTRILHPDTSLIYFTQILHSDTTLWYYTQILHPDTTAMIPHPE